MKKFIAIGLVMLMMLSMCACGGEKAGNETQEQPQEKIEVPYPLDQYNLDAYIQPYWDNQVMYQESVMVLENEDGTVSDIPLLYHADAIVSVRSSDLRTEYQEGTDYTLVDGKLHIPEGSAVTRVAYRDYYPVTQTDKSMALNPNYGFGYIFYSEGAVLHSMQIAVTYTHSDPYTGNVPAYKGDSLPKTRAKIANNEQLEIVVLGDSISTGLNSSGKVGAQPMAQTWFEMFETKLRQDHNLDNFTLYNPSVSGKKSDWGAQEATNAVSATTDLCIIAFGMNDGTKQYMPQYYQSNIRSIMDTARRANPDCEFVLIATMLPNQEAADFYGNQKELLPALLELEGEGVVVADMTTFHEGLLAQKRYYDMTGNNVNHPNDFVARAYAQVLWQTVIGY